jgi:dTMP kinase
MPGAAREHKRYVVIDATGTVDAIAQAIADAARDRLGA